MQDVLQAYNQELLSDLTKAINGEYNAIHFYEQLAELAPNDATKKRILEIRKDEMVHFQSFCSIYCYLTGQQYYPNLIDNPPTTFKSGVKSSFFDEQNTVEFYHQVARNTSIPYISHVFRTNAADEQNHAVWFLFLLNDRLL